jgi:alanyl-tRNA synthetase
MHRYQEAFLFEHESIVVKALEKDGFLEVELTETIFYPGGGGQPCDFGTIEKDDFSGDVVEVYKDGDNVIHKVKTSNGLAPGDKVKLKVNRDRRVRLIKMHTGEHILFKSLEKNLGDISLVKIGLGEEESSLFIAADDVTWDKILRAEEMANQVISENRKITTKEYPKTDAVMMDRLRIKADRIHSDTVRVLEIKDFDLSACTGTHADSTGFVVNLLITNFNQAKGGYEIRFKVDVRKDLFELAGIARKAASTLGSEIKGLPDAVQRLQETSEKFKIKYRDISAKLLDHNKSETVKGYSFISNVVEDVEKKQMVDKSNAYAVGKNVVCFVSVSEGKAMVILNCSKELGMNAAEILNKALMPYGGRGGGKDNFAMGSMDPAHADAMIEAIKNLL